MKFKPIVMLAALAAVRVLAEPVPYAAQDAGTIFLGPIADQDWGRPVASGDLDGDGYDELIVSACESFGGVISRVYVVRGGPDAHMLGTVNLAMGGVDQVILGAAANDNLGASLATGDVTGDGIDDLLICASTAEYFSRPAAGIAYLIYGGANFFDSSVRDLSLAGSWNLRIGGPVAGGDMGGSGGFGGSDANAAAIGRINDDEFADIILGAHLADGAASESGRVYVVNGGPYPSGLTLNLGFSTNYAVRIDGARQLDELGTFILTADLTGDGIDELILPTEYASQGLFTSEGAAYIFRGRASASWPSLINLATTAADITLLGDFNYDQLGGAAAVGDFNSDGVMDLAVAAPGADLGTPTTQRGDGFVYGLLGSAGYQTGTHLIDYATAVADFLIIGEFEENLGSSMSAGDFNADGYDDIAAGEWFAGPNINGSVDVLFGREFSGNPVFTAAETTNVRIVGGNSDRISFWMSASDMNDDGRDEIVFSAIFNNGGSGTVYVLTHLGGDADRDGDRDLADFASFQQCFTNTPPPSADCVIHDFDVDGDIDLADLSRFVDGLDGP